MSTAPLSIVSLTDIPPAPPPLTEQRVREIIREEIAWALKLAAPPVIEQRQPIGLTPAATRRAERNQAFADAYTAGSSMRAIAIAHGVHENTVAVALHRLGLGRDTRPSRKDALAAVRTEKQARREAMAEDYRSGMTLLEVAAKHGCAADTVKSACLEYGVPIRPQGERKHATADPRLPQMIEMHNRGMTLVAIGAELKITRERVRQLFVKAGFDHSQRPPTPEEREVVEAYIAGENIGVSMARLGVSAARFRHLIARCGHVPRQKERRNAEIVDERARRTAEMKRAGKSYAEIVAEMGFKNVSAVYWHLNRARGKLGLSINPPTPTKSPERKEA